jgi:hypothetical protein
MFNNLYAINFDNGKARKRYSSYVLNYDPVGSTELPLG